jgi:CelD/BcsL family acetyltransferase involved in cellulose biosynthesis
LRERANTILEPAPVDTPAKTANIHVVDPLSDRRWEDLVARHPNASAFHERGWLQALARTYGYEPLVLTTALPGERLTNGVVLCRISSWLTGTRLVSLPFADHCEPLLDDLGDFQKFMNWLRAECCGQRRRYVELRPLLEIHEAPHGFRPSRSFWFHELDLSPSLGLIFRQMHKNSFQRKVRRAERERLSYESGSSEQLVDEFYRLLLMTRRRHRLIPQPLSWFRNLGQCMGRKIQIRLARKNGSPIAAMLTLQHRSSVVYKYGCSDEKFHHLGGMPFLFWRLIEESKACGAEKIDFGRSELDNAGLITFKDRLGTRRKLLTYYRYTNQQRAEAKISWESRAFRGIFSSLPDVVLSTVGSLLYKHLG